MTQHSTNYIYIAEVLAHLDKCVLLWALSPKFEAQFWVQMGSATCEVEETSCLRTAHLSFRFCTLSFFQIDSQYLGLNYDTLSYWMLMVPIWWGETCSHLAFLWECCVGEVAATMDYFRDLREKDLLWKPGVCHMRNIPIVHEHFLKTWKTYATQNRFVLTMSWHFLPMIFSTASVVDFFQCLYVASVGGLWGKNHHTVHVFSARPFWWHTLFPKQSKEQLALPMRLVLSLTKLQLAKTQLLSYVKCSS